MLALHYFRGNSLLTSQNTPPPPWEKTFFFGIDETIAVTGLSYRNAYLEIYLFIVPFGEGKGNMFFWNEQGGLD